MNKIQDEPTMDEAPIEESSQLVDVKVEQFDDSSHYPSPFAKSGASTSGATMSAATNSADTKSATTTSSQVFI